MKQLAPTLALGFAVGFTTMTHRSGFAVLYPAMVADRGWSVSEVTAAFSVAMLLYSAAVVLVGQLVDRIGVRATMLGGALVLGVGLAAVGLVTQLWQLFLLYGIAIGFGSAAVGFVAMIKLLSLRAGRRLGLALGLFNAGTGVGALVSSPLMQVIVDGAGWRAACFAMGGIVILSLVPLILIAAPGRAESRAPAHGARAASLADAWRLPAFWLMMLASSVAGYLMLLPTHQVAHLVNVGLPNVGAASIGGMMGAFIGLGAVLGGWWADRSGLRRLGPTGALLLSVGVLALIGTSSTSILLPAVYILAGGIGRGMIGVNVAAVQGRAFAGPFLGRITGLLDLGFGFGAFAGPFLAAVLFDQTGSYAPGLVTVIVAGWASAVCVLLALRTTKL